MGKVKAGQRSQHRTVPPGWVIVRHAAWALPLAVVLLLGIYLGLDQLVPAGKDSSARTLDIAKVALAVGAVIGAVLTGIYAYRQQVLAEEAGRRADTELFHSRLSTASELLAGERAAARLSGVYALAALADDWDGGQQLCIDVLCVYLQLPYDGTEPGERQVRRTVVRVIRDHLRADRTPSWSGRRFRFEGATFDGGDLTGARFVNGSYVNFHRARFIGDETFFFNRVYVDESSTLDLSKVTFDGPVSFKGLHIGPKQRDAGNDGYNTRWTFAGALLGAGANVSFGDVDVHVSQRDRVVADVFDGQIPGVGSAP